MNGKNTLWYIHTIEYYAEIKILTKGTPQNMDEVYKHKIQQMKQERKEGMYYEFSYVNIKKGVN